LKREAPALYRIPQTVILIAQLRFVLKQSHLGCKKSERFLTSEEKFGILKARKYAELGKPTAHERLFFEK
jgi:hypothetical protein